VIRDSRLRRLLTIGHSYVVALNRRLAHEMAIHGRGRWEVTAAAPASFAGDLRRIALEPIEHEACRVVPLPMAFVAVPHLMFYGRGTHSLLRERWDVIHCWEEPYVAAAYQIARAAAPDVRFVFATFQNIAKRYPPPLSWFERRVVGRADGWIAFGETVHATLAPRRGYRDLPSRVIPPGIDADVFTPDAAAGARVRRQIGWEGGTPVIGFLGRFIEAKGIRVLTSVLPALRTPWRALFVGDGPERAELEALAAAHPGQVHIATGVPHSDVPAYLNAMDVLCAPSQTTTAWREQFGRMSIEAMACGVPVVASDSGEIPHVVGDAGVIVAERDLTAWRAALEALLLDPQTRNDLAVKGRTRARERYAWPLLARQHLEFFDEICG
jgi:glycosyltransferase involved in cell wall biosynthesis